MDKVIKKIELSWLVIKSKGGNKMTKEIIDAIAGIVVLVIFAIVMYKMSKKEE